jgi:CRISPR-associated protein Cas5d
MNQPIHLRVWGDLACFTRPEMKVERVSYPVITPSAARGLLEAILYKPQFRWRVHRIAVRRPVRFLAFRRNEVKSKAAARNPQPILAEEDRTQRNTLALRDVDYVIEASLELTALANQPRRKPPGEDEPPGDDNLGKYYGMARRRIENGQCFSQPCFGCREFPAHFEPADADAMRVPAGLNPDTDLGLMLYDVFDLDALHSGQKAEARPRVTFFRARLENGIVTVPPWSEVKKQLGGAA